MSLSLSLSVCLILLLTSSTRLQNKGGKKNKKQKKNAGGLFRAALASHAEETFISRPSPLFSFLLLCCRSASPAPDSAPAARQQRSDSVRGRGCRDERRSDRVSLSLSPVCVCACVCVCAGFQTRRVNVAVCGPLSLSLSPLLSFLSGCSTDTLSTMNNPSVCLGAPSPASSSSSSSSCCSTTAQEEPRSWKTLLWSSHHYYYYYLLILSPFISLFWGAFYCCSFPKAPHFIWTVPDY